MGRNERAVRVAMAAMWTLGCHGVARVGDARRERGAPAMGASAAGFHRIDERIPAPPSVESLVREASVGVAIASGDQLDARMQVRPLHMPHPMRGGNARFNFDGGRRGWITATPIETLLLTPAFANGRLFVGGGFSSHELYALDAYTGEMVWSTAAPDGGPSSAIVKDDDVMFNTESCTLFVVSARTGEPRWHRFLGDPLMSQPAADGTRVFTAYPTEGHHAFTALDRADGHPLWAVPIAADVIQAPTVHGDSVYFATMDGGVYRLARADGHEIWHRDVGSASAVWVDGDHVLVSRRVNGAFEQPIVLAAQTGALTSAGERFAAPYFSGRSRDRSLVNAVNGAWGGVPHGDHLGLANVTSGWAYQGSTPAVADGRAYFAIGGEIRARDMATGHDVWRRTYAEAEGAQAVSPPAVVGSQLVFGTVDGHVYAVDIDTGMTVWSYDVGEPVVFQPIVAQGWLYFTTARGHIVGLEVGDAAFDGWHMWGGNAEHAGLVESAGAVDPRLLASLERPSQGTLRLGQMEPALEPPPQASAHVAHAGAAAPATGVSRDTSPTAPEESHPDLPLAHTTVHAEVSGFVARVTVTQQFQNPYPRPIEAVYLFPLPADAAVDAMEMHVGSRVLRARIQRRAQAQQTYVEARASGRRAALLEQQRPNLFAQRVANLQPGERIDVQIQYAQTLPFEQGSYEFSFPMVAPRRFDPAHPHATQAPRDPLAATNLPSVAAAGGDLRSARDIDLTVDVHAGLPLTTLVSPTHHIETVRTGDDRAHVQLATGDTIANRDFVLRYDVRGDLPRATVLAHRDDTGGYFTLLVQPPDAPRDAAVARRDLTFVIDTSSSLHGRPLAQTQAVMHAVLAGMRADDRFNVWSFADRVQPWSTALVAATPANVTHAAAYIDGLHATGTTQMVAAVRAVLEASHASDDPSRVPIVVLVTDGFIGNEADVLRSVAENLGRTRLYTLGVGSAVNRFLLERAAELGRGRALVATLSEPPGEIAAHFASFIDRPVFTDVTVDFGGLDVHDVYPSRVPDLFAAAPVSLTGRFERGGHGTVRVRGTLGGARYERTVDVDLPAESHGDGDGAQRSLWARTAVHQRMNALYLRDDPTLIEQVTQLGLDHHLVTPWTSFVAVDDAPATSGASTAPSDPVVAGVSTTITPARALPGDPEVRIAAPADARAVTVILPFGETVAATYEPELGQWTARFLIPRSAPDGNHAVRVVITLRDGTQERRLIGYTVDSAPPVVRFTVVGAVQPGHDVTLRATQIVTEADLAQAGVHHMAPAHARLLLDARHVDVRLPDGAVSTLVPQAVGVWTGRWHVPSNTPQGPLSMHVFVVDLAANVREQIETVQVRAR